MTEVDLCCITSNSLKVNLSNTTKNSSNMDQINLLFKTRTEQQSSNKVQPNSFISVCEVYNSAKKVIRTIIKKLFGMIKTLLSCGI